MAIALFSIGLYFIPSSLTLFELFPFQGCLYSEIYFLDSVLFTIGATSQSNHFGNSFLATDIDHQIFLRMFAKDNKLITSLSKTVHLHFY